MTLALGTIPGKDAALASFDRAIAEDSAGRTAAVNIEHPEQRDALLEAIGIREDGADEALGAKANAPWSGTGAGSVIAILKAIWTALTGVVRVGGITVVTAVAPVVSTTAYANGDVIGTKMTFAGFGRVAGGTGMVQMASIMCKSAQTFAADLILFHTNPAASTFTDNAPLAVNVADFDKIIGVIHITDWTNLGTPSFAEATQLAMAYKVADTQTDIYAVLVARSTPTLGATSDIKVAIKALLD